MTEKILNYYDRTKFDYAGGAGGWLDILGFPFARGRIFQELEEDKGQIRYNDYWYKGFSILLIQIQQLIDKYKIRVFNSPTDILTMFDKEKTHHLLAQNKIEKTPFLGIVTNYYQFINEDFSLQELQKFIQKYFSNKSLELLIAYLI